MKNFFKIVLSLFLLFSISSFALDSKDDDVGKVKIEVTDFDQFQETVKSIDLTNSDELVSFSKTSNRLITDKEFITQSKNKDFSTYSYIDKLKESPKYCKQIERYYCKISF